MAQGVGVGVGGGSTARYVVTVDVRALQAGGYIGHKGYGRLCVRVEYCAEGTG